MAFDQSSISGLTLARDGTELLVSWSSTAPEGTTFQVYVARRRNVSTTHRAVHLPWPQGRVAVSVGTVAAGEELTDFSASLPASPQDRVTLAWQGGTYLSATLAGYRVYGSTSGPVVAPANLLATVPAYTSGVITDGFGMGGFGQGGYGYAAANYSLTTDPLASGTWTFAIVPFDAAGNLQGSPATVTQAVAVPPLPPAADDAGSRLSYTYHLAGRTVTLAWQASP